MMNSEDLAFLLGMAAGFGITLLIEAAILLVVYVLIRKEDDE